MTELLNYQNTTTLLQIYNSAYEECTNKRIKDKILYLMDYDIEFGICNALICHYNLNTLKLTDISEFFFSSNKYRWPTPYFLYQWGSDPIEGLMPRIQWLTRRSKELL